MFEIPVVELPKHSEDLRYEVRQFIKGKLKAAN